MKIRYCEESPKAFGDLFGGELVYKCAVEVIQCDERELFCSVPLYLVMVWKMAVTEVVLENLKLGKS